MSEAPLLACSIAMVREDSLLDRSDEGTGEGSEHEERRPNQLPEACMHEQGSSGSDRREGASKNGRGQEEQRVRGRHR